jgi:hypothetical protein
MVHGIDAGFRSAIFRPIGWLVLAAALGALYVSRWRSAVQLPAEPSERPPGMALTRLLIILGRRRDRTLH